MQLPETPLRLGSVWLSTGVRLHYAEAGTPGAPVVLFLHGYSDSWQSFSTVLPLLPPTVHAFALSQRGHGDSEQPPCCYGLGDLAADALAFLDARGIEQATIVGHSMGSFVARRVARRVAATSPRRVARLVLAGAGTTLSTEGTRALAEEIDALPDPVPEAFVRAFQLSTIYHPIPESLLETVVAESAKLQAQTWRALMRGMLSEDPPAPGQMQIPTLLLWGEHDAVFDALDQERLCAILPNATLKIYPETGHALHWERPTDFVSDLMAFVAEGAVQAP